MGRNVVLCFDGTSNKFGSENTNVVRLIQVLARDTVDLADGGRATARQLLYYDPGVGTLPEPGVWSSLGKKLSELGGLALGAGLMWKVESAYQHLMDYCERDDRVYLFGFSRGAYTARVLAGLLHTLGLLPRGNHNMIPYVTRLYKSLRKGAHNGETDTSWYWKLCEEFRWTFSRPSTDVPDDRRFRVHFVGVWDTVSSVGWVWNPASFPFTARNPSISIVRHAVSIDERRWFFRQNLMQPVPGQDFKEYWFPGVHADVGGGYPETEGGLWRGPFAWMLHEAEAAGLHVDLDRKIRVLGRSPTSRAPWCDPQHNSLTPLWWPLELVPKFYSGTGAMRSLPRLGLWRRRSIPVGSMIQHWGLRRIREDQYMPGNMSAEFVSRVKAMTEVPEAEPYRLSHRQDPA